MIVKLPKHIMAQARLWAHNDLPFEACGLLTGAKTSDGFDVECLHRAPNIAADPETCFEVDPLFHLALQKKVRAEGGAIIGVWHSHPRGCALPSQRDRKQSHIPNWLWLITSCQGNAPHMQAFMAKKQPSCFSTLEIQLT